MIEDLSTPSESPTSLNLATWLRSVAGARPGDAAVRSGERTISWAELAERSRRLAAYLVSADLSPGDRIGVLIWNSPEFIEVLLACLHGGFPIVPVNARATSDEAAQILNDAGVSALVYAPEYAEHSQRLERGKLLISLESDKRARITLDAAVAQCQGREAPTAVRGDHTAWIFYTSGTTGVPKGAMLSHRNLLAMVMAYLADIRRLDSSSIVLHAAPLTHGSGLYALPAIARGATQVLTTSHSYDPAEVLDLIAAWQVSDIAFLSPTMLNRLVDHFEDSPVPIDSLENIVYGGAPMHREDLFKALEALGPILTQIYGQAEAPVTIGRLGRAEHRQALSDDHDRLLSAGSAYTNVEIAVKDEQGSIKPTGYGEILSRSDAVMTGYWNNPDASAESLQNGWLHTGDLGRIEPDGTIYLLDRSKDVIISGGSNVYPREVEELVLEHPDVEQVAVVGAPDPEWGERVVAVLVAKDGASVKKVREQVSQLCRDQLSGYKIPRQFDFRDKLPTSPYGKVLKRDIRDALWRLEERKI